MDEQYKVVSDFPEYVVWDSKYYRDLFTTKSGNRDYACRQCTRNDAELIADALNAI